MEELMKKIANHEKLVEAQDKLSFMAQEGMSESDQKLLEEARGIIAELVSNFGKD